MTVVATTEKSLAWQEEGDELLWYAELYGNTISVYRLACDWAEAWAACIPRGRWWIPEPVTAEQEPLLRRAYYREYHRSNAWKHLLKNPSTWVTLEMLA